MPRQLQDGDWDAAFLAEPYITTAGEDYGEQVLADFDQGAALNFPIDGYLATQAWTQQHPKTAAAFMRAIEQGQAIANSDPSAVQAAMAQYDNLPPEITAAIALTGFPGRPGGRGRIQRVAKAMLEFGMLGRQDNAEVEQRTLIKIDDLPQLSRRLSHPPASWAGARRHAATPTGTDGPRTWRAS